MGKGSKQRPTDMAAFSAGYDNIWKKDKDMQMRVEEKAEEIGKCGCGRSPTGKCIGWHGLTEDAFQARLAEFKAQAEAAAK